MQFNQPLFFQHLQRVKHSMVFNGRGDGMFEAIGMNGACDNCIVRFCSSGSKNNFSGCALKKFGYLLSSGLNRSANLAPMCMCGGGISKILKHERLHCLK